MFPTVKPVYLFKLQDDWSWTSWVLRVASVSALMTPAVLSVLNLNQVSEQEDRQTDCWRFLIVSVKWWRNIRCERLMLLSRKHISTRNSDQVCSSETPSCFHSVVVILLKLDNKDNRSEFSNMKCYVPVRGHISLFWSCSDSKVNQEVEA